MFKIRVSTNFQPIKQLEAYVSQFDQIAIQAGEAAYKRIAPGLKDDLSYVPTRVKYPIQWTSERQRRFYFAVIAQYDPQTKQVIPYRQTGRSEVVKYWRVEGKRSGGKFSLVISNPSDAVPYIYGAIDFRRKTQTYPPQQQFHKNTGWVPIQKTATFWFDAFQDEVRKELDKSAGRFGLVTTKRRNR